MTRGPSAIVLLSGGLDSTTCLAVAKAQRLEVFALSFRYGQRHEQELKAAARIAQHFGVTEHRVIDIDLRVFGGSALTDEQYPVPKGRALRDMEHGVPVTYVPARNTIFLSYALAWAEVLGCFDIFLGVNAVDYSGYPDCRPEYVAAFQHMANLATRAGVEGQHLRIHTPLIHLTKAEIIALGLRHGVDYSMTSTCYDPDRDGGACGQCDACLLRRKGFLDNGIADPTHYTRILSR